MSKYNDNLPNATFSFTLGPNSFGKFSIRSTEDPNTTHISGYGKICQRNLWETGGGLSFKIIFEKQMSEQYNSMKNNNIQIKT